MNIDVIGIEVGVLVPPEDAEFGHYACNNPELPFGFYDENQYAVQGDCFERERRYVEEYVLNGVEGTYGVISEQGVIQTPPKDEWVDDLTDFVPISYSFFRNANEVLYSVCKKDGKLVEGFLEKALKQMKDKTVDALVEEAEAKQGEVASLERAEVGLEKE